jgi:hypothetical protein
MMKVLRVLVLLWLTVAMISCDAYWPLHWGFKNASQEEITVEVYKCDGIYSGDCNSDPIKHVNLLPGEAIGLELIGDFWDIPYLCFGAYTAANPQFAGCGKGCAYLKEYDYEDPSSPGICHDADNSAVVPTTVITNGSPVPVSGYSAQNEAAN